MRKRAVGDASPASVVSKKDQRPAQQAFDLLSARLSAVGSMLRMRIKAAEDRIAALETKEVEDAPKE